MSDNPYTPPSSDLGVDPSLPPSGTGDFDLGTCFRDAWERTWSHFPLWLGVGVVGTLAGVAAALTGIGMLLVVPVLGWGATYFCLRVHDGGAEFGDLFAGFSRYGNALVGFLVCIILTTLIGLVGQSVQILGEWRGDTVLRAVGMLINWVFALFVSSRLTFAYFYIVDRDFSAVEALGQAWADTAPVIWKVVGLVLLGVAIMIGGGLALLVGLIPATMIVFLMWVSAYRQLTGGPA